jgi:predicted Rdx family selenoprotein
VAAAIERETGGRVELIEGSGGVFTLSVDGTVAFEKRLTGRFPTEEEAVGLVMRHAGGYGEGPARHRQSTGS